MPGHVLRGGHTGLSGTTPLTMVQCTRSLPWYFQVCEGDQLFIANTMQCEQSPKDEQCNDLWTPCYKCARTRLLTSPVVCIVWHNICPHKGKLTSRPRVRNRSVHRIGLREKRLHSYIAGLEGV